MGDLVWISLDRKSSGRLLPACLEGWGLRTGAVDSFDRVYLGTALSWKDSVFDYSFADSDSMVENWCCFNGMTNW